MDLDLSDAGTRPRCVGRYETVHLSIQLYLLQHVTTVCLEGAPEILESNPGDTGDDPVRDPRRDDPDGIVLAVLAPPAGDVVSLVDFLHQAWDVVRIVLHVAVHEDDRLAPAVVDARLDGGGLPEISPEAQEADPRIVRDNGLEQSRAPVCAAVVDVEQLERAAKRLEHVDDLPVQRGDVLNLVENQDDHR